jgi:outer membrane murein-binding lipoprotein Lpp
MDMSRKTCANKKIIAVSVLIAILFVGSIAGTVIYYNGALGSKNSKINSLNNEINSLNNKVANLTSQISNLKSQLTNLTFITANLPTAHLVASLGITEILGKDSNEMGKSTPIPYNYLYITGSVSNTGESTAYNAGLHVVAYNATGTLEINMTVPLSGGIFGTDNATNAFVLEHYGSSSPTLGLLDGGQTTSFYAAPEYYGSLSILHEGIVTNWSITPVWTNIS